MLQGSVQSLNLATILQDLAADERSGVLTLRQAERHLHVWFDGGVIRLLGLPGGRGPSVLRGLVALGVLDPADLPPPGATARQERTHLNRLLRHTDLDRDTVCQALVHQMTEHLCEALVWSPADFTFDEGDQADDERFDLSQEALGVRLPGEALMMEALRRNDELEEAKRALVPPGEILVPAGNEPPEDADETTLRLWQEINGERSLAELMERTHLGPFAVFKAVGILQASGCVKSLALDEVVQRARRHAAKKDWARALRLCEYGLEREPARLELRHTAARCLQAQGEDARAVAEYRRLAATHAEEGRADEALTCLGHILEMVPEDIDAHQRCLQLRLGQGDHEGAREALGALTRAAHKAGLLDKVRDASAQVLEAIGEDQELREHLADLQLTLGERKEASRLYQGLLQEALRQGRDEAALRFARTLRKLHPRTQEYKDILARLESGEHLRARIQRRWRRIQWSVAGAILLVLALGAYEAAARLDLSRRRAAVLDATVEGRLADALAEYDSFLARWSFTLVRREVQTDRAQLEERFTDQQLTDARDLHAAGQVAAAIGQLESAAGAVHDADAARRLATQRDTWRQDLQQQEGAVAQEIRALVAAVEEDHDEAAAQALGEVTDPLAVPTLCQLLRRPTFRIRRRALESLGHIPTFEAGLGLVEALTDPDAELRHVAAEFLGRQLAARTPEGPLPDGLDPVAWDRALRTAWMDEVHAARLHVSLRALPDDPQHFAWHVVNLGRGPLLLQFHAPPPSLTLLDAEFQTGPLPTDLGVARDMLLYPGDYLGGVLRVELPAPDPEATAHRRLLWSAKYTGGGETRTLRSAPLVLPSPPPAPDQD